LSVFAACAGVFGVMAAVWGGEPGLWALVIVSFFMSIMFPTIFATSVQGLGNLTKTGSSLLVMSIIGGGALTMIMGLISDASHIRTAFIVTTICFAVIALYAFRTKKTVAPVVMTGH
jgi:FHS family L-fucose permease-like MFS transporter